MESQCQNQRGGYAPVWMHHLKIGKPSVQDNLLKVCVWHKLSSHKIIIKTSGLCPSVSISKTKIYEKRTTNHTSSDRNEPPPLKGIVVTWREYLTFSKEKTCLNVKNIKQGGYASTKMHSDRIMPWCKLVSLRPNANERVMPQYRANPGMTKLHYKLS